MQNLSLKIPPLLVMIIFSVLMLALWYFIPIWRFSLPVNGLLALFFVLFGLTVSFSGVYSFHKAKTTVNPLSPDAASCVVDSGVYRYSRNPMYLGFLSILIGVACLIPHAGAFLLLPLFVVYMNCFQIKPEEQILKQLFNDKYVTYMSKVRRWL